jgi:imidazolonepropionase-like amidohydrolase
MGFVRYGYALVYAAIGTFLVGCAQPQPDAPSTSPETAGTLAGATVLQARRLYVDPASPPIDNGVIVMRDGKIVLVGTGNSLPPIRRLPRGHCAGGVVTAGFHNNHVHFTESKFEEAAERPSGDLALHLERMLTSYGFTTVTDVGSDVENTAALRKRIESGEVAGPRILTAGWPQYPHNGIPFYLADLPPEFLARLRQPESAIEASRNVVDNLGRGADATKLFVATPQSGGKIARMDPAVIRAAVQETHQRGHLVFAHPTDNAGLRAALDAGVDVVVHTTLERGPTKWEPALVNDMVTAKMGVIPTLQLWGYELKKTSLPDHVVKLAIGDAVEEVRVFSHAGGQVLFGTDVGYMTEYNPTEEYALMSRAGLSTMQILASLTTAPAARWNEDARRGALRVGMDADLVVLEDDPADDAGNFARVKCTFRGGELLYSSVDKNAGP